MSRIDALQKWLTERQDDPLVLHALAIEYAKAGEPEKALQCWTSLREKDRSYLPVYYPAAELAMETGQTELAEEWLAQGILVAREKGDQKTERELRSLREIQDE